MERGTALRAGRVSAACGLLSLLVVLAAGTEGRTHFGGVRWVPHIRIAAHTPAQHRQPAPPPPARVPTSRGGHGAAGFPLGSVVLWTLVGVVALGLAFLLWRWWAARPSRAAGGRRAVSVQSTAESAGPTPPEPEPDLPALRSGIELALEALEAQHEPGDAIVRAWLGLQETAAEQSGIVRQPAETPTEFTSRIVSRALRDDRAVRTLLRLYLRARFSDSPVTGDDVEAVRAALAELVVTWPSAR